MLCLPMVFLVCALESRLYLKRKLSPTFTRNERLGKISQTAQASAKLGASATLVHGHMLASPTASPQTAVRTKHSPVDRYSCYEYSFLAWDSIQRIAAGINRAKRVLIVAYHKI